MEHTHYFMQLGHCTQSKNKLQAEIHDYFKSLSGMLIEKSDLPELKERIQSEIQNLNEKYPRMKPIQVSFSHYGFNNQIFVTSAESISFRLYLANLVVPVKLPYFSPTLN